MDRTEGTEGLQWDSDGSEERDMALDGMRGKTERKEGLSEEECERRCDETIVIGLDVMAVGLKI